MYVRNARSPQTQIGKKEKEEENERANRKKNNNNKMNKKNIFCLVIS